MRGIGELKKLINSNFFEYLSYFSAILLINTVLVGGALYAYSASAFRREANDTNTIILEQLKNAQGLVLNEVDKSLARIYLDQRYLTFTDFIVNRDVQVANALQSDLVNIVNANEYIYSVALYYPKDNTTLSSDVGIERAEMYHDYAFLKTLSTQVSMNGLIRPRTVVSKDGTDKVPVVSFVKPMPIFNNGKPIAYVVSNIKASALNKMLTAIERKQEASIIITDEDGTLLSQSQAPVVSAQVISDGRRMTGPEEFGSYSVRTESGRNLVSYVYSKNYHWWYYYVLPDHVVTRGVRLMGWLTLAICVAVIFLSAILSVVFTRRIYNPIRGLLDILGGHKNEDQTADKETVSIRENVQQLLDQNRNMSDLLKEYDISQRNTFLKGLLSGTQEMSRKLEERLAYYHVNFRTTDSFVVLLISMDNHELFLAEYTEKQKNMLLIYNREIIERIVQEKLTGCVIEAESGDIAVIVALNAEMRRTGDVGEVQEVAQQIHESISKNIKTTFTLGISRIQENTNGIQDAYAEAVSAVNQRFIQGFGHVIPFAGIRSAEEELLAYPFRIENKMMAHIRGGDVSGMFEALEDFNTYIFEHATDEIEFIRQYYLQLVSAVFKCIYETERRFEPVFGTQKQIYTAMLTEKTMTGIATNIQKLLQQISENSKEQKLEKSKQTMCAVLEYIRNNIGSELSVEYISEYFKISTPQLRRLFRQETGATVKEYIDSVRMKAAKDLLSETDMKVGEIAERIGYLSLQTFVRAFKLSVGQTPGEFRAQTNKEQADI